MTEAWVFFQNSQAKPNAWNFKLSPDFGRNGSRESPSPIRLRTAQLVALDNLPSLHGLYRKGPKWPQIVERDGKRLILANKTAQSMVLGFWDDFLRSEIFDFHNHNGKS